MLQSILSTLRPRPVEQPETKETRRTHLRRKSDRCVAVICGQTFPVENWSPGGILLAADERLFSVGQDVDITVKFKLRNVILDISHHTKVIRKGAQKVALAFDPLPQTIRHAFQQVIDDQVAREFANSQAV